MSVGEEPERIGGVPYRGGAAAVSRKGGEALPVAFNRNELDILLGVYGRHVASGEWRDYAIDHLKDRAVFSIYRRTNEMPLYRIEKDPKRARKQGLYAVLSQSGQVLKRGHDLRQALRVVDRSLRLVKA